MKLLLKGGTVLRQHEKMLIPKEPYVGLYGSHFGDWRAECIDLLEKANISWFDPTDDRWKKISAENGDKMQALVDRLVAREHLGLLNATCVIFHLSSPKHLGDNSQSLKSLAARCELGFLTGKGIPTFVHIEPDVEGRNYLWGQIKKYSHMIRCKTLFESTQKAIEYMCKLQ